MVIKGYTVAQLLLCQPLKTGHFLKLKLIRDSFLVHETLPNFPSKMYTEVSSQLWLNSMEYLPKGSRTGRVDRWGTHTDTSKQTWKELPGRFGAVFPGSLIMWIIIRVVSAVPNEQKRGYLKEGQKERGSSQIFMGSHCQALFAPYFFCFPLWECHHSRFSHPPHQKSVLHHHNPVPASFSCLCSLLFFPWQPIYVANTSTRCSWERFSNNQNISSIRLYTSILIHVSQYPRGQQQILKPSFWVGLVRGLLQPLWFTRLWN